MSSPILNHGSNTGDMVIKTRIDNTIGSNVSTNSFLIIFFSIKKQYHINMIFRTSVQPCGIHFCVCKTAPILKF